MLVIMSIISFWPSRLSSSVRVCISLVLVVFASFLTDRINDTFPVVAYTKVLVLAIIVREMIPII